MADMSITLAAGETFISAEGTIYKKGVVYTMPQEKAMKLLATQDDYSVRFFKKADAAQVAAAPTVADNATTNVNDSAALPTTEEISADMAAAEVAAGEAAANEMAVAEGDTSATGEMDTAGAARRVGRPPKAPVPV